ncbi:putative P-loop containing nucleoside triphosphate hydrolase [Rosa chinensis]|uniref:Putative P-loop containing nucleoside triphosphate hydrolase n=1 Tax=Rosa chinensis TaxID=74649 RepID=A0A2P6PIC3_ROSCH|nr:uncharacterized protein LOC112179456 isoform X1 [Rosa chinensis]PRQ21686.1 putative P-loop containing nucleoside triphosphate hydrolase [Rosa chinensis]
MKNHMHVRNSSSDDEKIIISDESSGSVSSIEPYCWWRSTAKYDEYVKLKFEGGLPDVSRLTTRMRVFKELERLALVASGSTSTREYHYHYSEGGVNELRHKLLTYQSGDFWMPIGGISKEKMDIPPVATILLVGFSASGKSSLVNLMYSVLGRSGLIPFAQTSSSGSGRTKLLKEHNVVRSLRSGFCVYDSGGFNYNEISETSFGEELSSWMNDGVHQNQEFLRSGDLDDVPPHDVAGDDRHVDFRTMSNYNWSSKFVRRTVNSVMVVANMAEIYKSFKAGDSKPMEATRQLFCSSAFRNCNDEKPILILTHGDMLSTEERIEGRLKICECVGVSETTGVYDIVCLTEYGFLAEESDPVSAYALTEAVYRALLISDRTHLPKKTHQDWALIVLSWIMCFIASLFSLIAEICFKLGGGGRQRDRHKLLMK